MRARDLKHYVIRRWEDGEVVSRYKTERSARLALQSADAETGKSTGTVEYLRDETPVREYARRPSGARYWAITSWADGEVISEHETEREARKELQELDAEAGKSVGTIQCFYED